MTPEEEVLGRVIDILDHLAVPYMVTGSIATSYHGRPRATHDADVVIDPTPDQLEAMVQKLETAGFYVDSERAREALRQRRQFNVIETARAMKIDLIVRRSRPFSVEEFKRRQRLLLGFGRVVDVVSVEDAILSKLEWARRNGDSERQIRRCRGRPRAESSHRPQLRRVLGRRTRRDGFVGTDFASCPVSRSSGRLTLPALRQFTPASPSLRALPAS